MAYPRFQRARAFRFFTRTAGDLTLNSATWANLPTIGTAFDIVLEAQVGDVIEAGMKGRLGNEAFDAALDVVTIVSGSYYASFATQSTTRPTAGLGPWRAIASENQYLGGSVLYTVTAGDLVSGQITLRVQYSQASAGNKTLNALGTGIPFQFYAKNLGPADPE